MTFEGVASQNRKAIRLSRSNSLSIILTLLELLDNRLRTHVFSVLSS